MMGERLNPMRGALMYPSNKNLLDNWYFVGGGSQQGNGQLPINQRGQTEQTANGYYIDRWLTSSMGAAAKITLVDGGLQLSGDGYTSQRIMISERMVDHPVTFSILLTTGELLSVTGIVPAIPSNFLRFAQNTAFQDIYLELYRFAESDGGYLLAQLNFLNDGGTVIAAKVEEGSIQTLAHKEGDTWVLNDPPPDYRQELAKCQAHQLFNIANTRTFLYTYYNIARFNVPVPVTMRKMPTIVGSPRIFRLSDNQIITPTSIRTTEYSSNCVYIEAAGINVECYINFPDGAGLDANV